MFLVSMRKRYPLQCLMRRPIDGSKNKGKHYLLTSILANIYTDLQGMSLTRTGINTESL